MHALLVSLLLLQTPNLPSLNGIITGVLKTASGKPAGGVRITVVVPPASPDELFSATSMVSLAETDSQGRYRLEGIPPGRYYISAGRVDLPTYYPGSNNLAGGTIVTVPPATTVSGMDFALRDESSGRATTFGNSSPTLQIPVAITVEGGGKVPIFQTGGYPVLKLTRHSNNQPFRMYFSSRSLMLPLPSGSATEEYTVAVADLKGYTVKSMTYGPADLQKETLKVRGQVPAMVQILGQTIISTLGSISTTTLQIVLESEHAIQRPTGTRVTGRSSASGDEVYLSGTAGTLYSDGTFEFQNVPPGLHIIMKYIGSNATAGAVIVGSRDVDNAVLQGPQLFPADFQSASAKPVDVPESRALPMLSILGQVLDETSKEPLHGGTVTLAGYGSTRRTFAIVAGDGFKIPDLLPGAYSLTINVPGYQSATQSVTVGFEDLKVDLIARKETP